MPVTAGDGRPRASVRRRHPDSATFAATPAARRRMQDQRARDTEPELALRRVLHAAGLRYRVDHAPLAGLRRRADLVFTRRRVAVFVDGCFWHSCPEHGNQPRTNEKWWAAKLARNRNRDADTDAQLRAAGWEVVRIWEHERPEFGAARVAAAVEQSRPSEKHE